jgi:hypothetical protein
VTGRARIGTFPPSRVIVRTAALAWNGRSAVV